MLSMPYSFLDRFCPEFVKDVHVIIMLADDRRKISVSAKNQRKSYNNEEWCDVSMHD